MNNWSIIEKMYLFFSYDGEKVSIANPESKKFWGPVQKVSESIKPPLTVDNTGSDIKIASGKVYLKFSGKYYKITNLETDMLLSQLSGATLTNGEASGVIFGFSQYNSDKVILIFPGTDLHKKTEEEFLRKIRLSLYKKTTKYIPGHKYDTEDGSFWFIGNYKTNITDKYQKEYGDRKQIDVNVFSNYLPDSKKVSDIWTKEFPLTNAKDVKNFSLLNGYPESIIFTQKSPLLVDSGEELEIDVELDKAYESKLNNFIKTEKRECSFGSQRYYYKNLSHHLSVFCLIPQNQWSSVISDDVKGKMKDIIRTNIEYILFKYYGSLISPKDDKETQVNKLLLSFKNRNFVNTSLIYSGEYYYDDLLLKLFEINLEDMALEAVKNFKEITINSFQDYIDNIGSFEFRKPENYSKTIDFIYTNEKKRKFSSYLPNGPYKDSIVKICKEAIDTNGSNLEEYNIEDVGTKMKPIQKSTMVIGLKDIMKLHGANTLYDLPDNLKEDLIKLNIYQTVITTRSDIVINFDE